MNTKKYRWLLYFITLTIVTTISVQVYWNYKNYLQNKQRVINEIQISLDNAVEEYFADIAKSSRIAFFDETPDSLNNSKNIQAFFSEIKIDSVFKNVTSKKTSKKRKK